MNTTNATAAPSADTSLAAAAGFSRYARRLIEAEPELANTAHCERPFDRSEMARFLAAADLRDEAGLMQSLRVLRKRVMLRVMARDLAGTADLPEVVATMTALAEASLATAVEKLAAWLEKQHGQPIGATSGKPQKLHVVGMGKLGGGELNVSSDIDPIFVYPEDGETDGTTPISNHEFFTRLGRRLIFALSELTADGYVFRVDMRLRPYGDGGPLAVSFDMLENYLITQGREWERYAWIKGRVVTGDRGPELMELVRPFVYRRHLDYSAFASMRDLHRQIKQEVARRDIAGNIKLGPGGIREIEFTAQLFQLIRGGRHPELRRQATLAVLPVLAERNLLPRETADELTVAYVLLRRLEHRLQYLDDQQTHELPASGDDRQALAQSMGYADYAGLTEALDRHRATVTRHFEQLFAEAPQDQHPLAGLWQESTDPERSTTQLAQLGFQHVSDLYHRLAAMRQGARYRQMPATSQARLDRLVPLAIETAAKSKNPDAALERVLGLFESISRRESYLVLLEEYPQALSRLTDLVAASPWVAGYLTQHPILLDELLDTRTLYAAPDWPVLLATLRVQLDDAEDDVEKRMDLLRHFKHAQTMRLIAQDLAGTLPLETLSDHLSDLACVILGEVLRLAWADLPRRHRDTPRFAIIGYGKLGGKELGYASDLDLVFLYDDDAPDAAQHYGRLAQRINNWLSTITAAGVLYETDLRLRPDGAGGLLVSPLASFREYQREKAWPWEHQALTRARFAAGDADIARAFEALRIEILRQPRDLAELKREIMEMRQKMLDSHPNPTPLFDLKHDRGGIIDVEFIVQYLVLGYAGKHAELTGNIGNLALLKLAGTLGLIDDSLAAAVHDGYRTFRKLQHSLRLQGEKYARVNAESVAASARAVRDLWTRVFAQDKD